MGVDRSIGGGAAPPSVVGWWWPHPASPPSGRVERRELGWAIQESKKYAASCCPPDGPYVLRDSNSRYRHRALGSRSDCTVGRHSFITTATAGPLCSFLLLEAMGLTRYSMEALVAVGCCCGKTVSVTPEGNDPEGWPCQPGGAADD